MTLALGNDFIWNFEKAFFIVVWSKYILNENKQKTFKKVI